jgi:L-aspartate oxidase
MGETRLQFDLIIIGSGISGLSAAITAAERGISVAIISKENDLEESNTHYAQGGIVYKGEDDSPELLKEDIRRAGSFINNNTALELLCRKGPDMVDEFLIKKLKIPFCKDEGKIDRTYEAAHSIRRIIHVKDHTGNSIEHYLTSYARNCENIQFYPGFIAIDLITNTHNSRDVQEKYRKTKVIGVYCLDQKKERVCAFFAPVVLLAAGGIGNLFLHTTNPNGATGDGIAMAYRIGAEIINSEYIQFHPTMLFHRDLERFLISESMRGEGARLINRKGEYFMERYSPELKDLAPRDEVARAIFQEMEAEGSSCVRLDTRLIKEIDIKNRFPQIFSTCLDLDIDIRKTPIPVVPGAHYNCGGIKVNINGQTSIPGLFAAGETACTGVHGANRLASVSLLEGLFYGMHAAKYICQKKIYSLKKSLLNSIPDWIYPVKEEMFESILIKSDMRHIQAIMWNYAGIIRTNKRLLRALADLSYLSHRIEQFYKQAKLNRGIIELRNSVLAATIIVRSAYSNQKPLGCHYIE